jgi:hypothetical protein
VGVFGPLALGIQQHPNTQQHPAPATQGPKTQNPQTHTTHRLSTFGVFFNFGRCQFPIFDIDIAAIL